MQNYFRMWKIFLMQVMSPLLGGIGFISALMLFQAAPAKAEFWLGSPSWTKSWPSFVRISKHGGKFFFYQTLKVPLTPNFFFLWKQSTSFPDFISEKIILIDKILAFLQAFEHVISMFMTFQSGIWVGLLVTSLQEPSWNTQETFDWA